MECIALSPGGHASVKKYVEGELVEVRQREKGLRGSWFPAVVIAVKPGKRIVEYEELLTEDGGQKLTECVPVWRAVDGVRGSSRLPSKAPSNRGRALIRPRPPETPDAQKLCWQKGLWVDCHHKDAWWEGVLTESIVSARKEKRARVYFPDEEDHESMFLKDMRIGQDWDEDLGRWIPRGFVDVPVSRREKRVRTISLGREARGLVQRRSPRDMELAISLNIEESGCSERVAEYTTAWNSGDRKSPNKLVEKTEGSNSLQVKTSVLPNSSPSAVSLSSEPHEGDVENQGSGNEGETTHEVLCLVESDRNLELVDREAVNAPPIARTQERATAFLVENEKDRSTLALQTPAIDRMSLRSSADGILSGEKQTMVMRESMDKPKVADLRSAFQVLDSSYRKTAGLLRRDGLDGKGNEREEGSVPESMPSNGVGALALKLVEPMRTAAVTPLASRRPGASTTTKKAAYKKVGIVSVQRRRPSVNVDGLDDDAARKLLIDSGWNVTQNFRKTGKAQWYYRAPYGELLGSLPSALAHWEKLNAIKGDDENPTLNDLKLQSSIIRDRKVREGSQHFVTPRNGKKNNVAVSSDHGASKSLGYANGLSSSRAIVPFCSGDHQDLLGSAKGDDRDVLEATNSKRSAAVLEDQQDLSEQKRRKTTGCIVEQSKSSSVRWEVRLEKGEASTGCSACGGICAGHDCISRNRLTGHDESDNMTDVNIVSLISKKRVCTGKELLQDSSNIMLLDGRMALEEPRSKKSRAISADAVSTPEGKNRKSLVTLQESFQHGNSDTKNRKKPFSPQKGSDFKQTKKGVTHDLKQVKKSAKKGKKSRAPARGVRLEVLLSAPLNKSDPSADGDTLLRKRTLLSWLIDNGMVEENDKVRYLNRKDSHCMLEGYVTRDGIMCDCCGNVVTLSVFEAHAGSKLHRPSANIFLDNNKSLSQCQVEVLARKSENEGESQKVVAAEQESDKSDDTCGICGDGGELICCDHCPSTFHLSCMGMEGVPDGDWYCPNCRCAICGGSQFNGDKSSFNDLTVIFCDQCECEYHVKCLRSRGIELDCCPQEDWFCGESCGRIFRGLRGLVGVSRPMEGGYSWTLLRSRAEDDRKSGCVSNDELNAEHDSKLAIALSVMQECFRPMVDPRTKIDIISHVLYNRRSDVSRLNYYGFYTMLLERGDELISVATIRVHGARLAEMPLIGTRFQYRRQGMCRRLMSALEEMLRTVGVERLVLPAVPELLETWTGAFGYKTMEGSERLQLMDLNIMAFPGTSLLFKNLEKRDSSGFGTCLAVSVSRTLMEDDRKKFVCPVEARKKRGRLARPRKGNLFGKFLSSVTNDQPVTIRVEQVTRFGGHSGGVLYRPASPTGSVLVESTGSEELVFTRTTPLPQTSCLTNVKKEVGLEPGPGQLLDKRMLEDDELESKKAATMKILKSVLGVGSHKTEVSATFAHSKMEDDMNVHCERSSEESSSIDEEEEELDHCPSIQTIRSNQEVITPGWLLKSINEAAKTPARPVFMRESTCKSRVSERQCQTDIPALESTTACSTKTYERRRTKLSPHTHREPLSRIRQMELADSDPVSRTLDFTDDPLPVQYYELEPVSVPMRTYPSQFTYRNRDIMPPGTFIPVQIDVVNTSLRGESGLADSWQMGMASSEDNVSGSSYDQREDYRSRGTGLMVRLKLSNMNLEQKKKKKKKKKRSKDLLSVVVSEKFEDCSPLTDDILSGPLLPASGSVREQRNRDIDVTGADKFDQGQSKMDRVAEPKYISVMVN